MGIAKLKLSVLLITLNYCLNQQHWDCSLVVKVLSFQLCADVLVNAGQLLESLHDLVRRIRKNVACNRTADHPSLSAV